jgi:hypothetical protein
MTTITVLLPMNDDPLADLLEAHGHHTAAAEVRGVARVPYLWHISQTENDDYDTFSDCVVVAFDEAMAKRIRPGFNSEIQYDAAERQFWTSGMWASSPGTVTAVCIGRAFDCEVPSIVCASFHAG